MYKSMSLYLKVTKIIFTYLNVDCITLTVSLDESQMNGTFGLYVMTHAGQQISSSTRTNEVTLIYVFIMQKQSFIMHFIE